MLEIVEFGVGFALLCVLQRAHAHVLVLPAAALLSCTNCAGPVVHCACTIYSCRADSHAGSCSCVMPVALCSQRDGRVCLQDFADAVVCNCELSTHLVMVCGDKAHVRVFRGMRMLGLPLTVHRVRWGGVLCGAARQGTCLSA